MANRGGMHHADLLLKNPLHDATLNAAAWQRDALWPVQPDARALRLDGALLLPAALTGMSGVMLEVNEGHYADAGGFGDGHVALTLNGVALPESDERLAAGLSLTLAREEQRWFARADDLTMDVAGEAFRFEPLYLQGLLPKEETGLQAAAELMGDTRSQPTRNSGWVIWHHSAVYICRATKARPRCAMFPASCGGTSAPSLCRFGAQTLTWDFRICTPAAGRWIVLRV